MASEKPLFGYGPFSFRYVYPKIQTTFLAVSDHPHNWIIKIATENGVPAALLFLTFLAYLVFTHKRNFEKLDVEDKTFVSFLSISLMGAVLHNMIDYNMNFLTTILLFWVILGMYRQYSENFGVTKVPKFLIFAALMFIGIFASYETINIAQKDYRNSFFPRDYFLEKEVDLQYQLKLNPHDARAWNSSGNFEKALEEDPMNNFAYYKNSLRELIVYGSGEFEEITQKVLPLLQSYEPMLSQNLHFTAFTGNPEEAAEIYRILGDEEKARMIF